MKRYLGRLLAAVCVAALLVSGASALTVEQAIGLLEEHYVDDLPAAAYEAATLDELFQAVGDPYTYYMDAEEYAEFIASVEGSSHVGVGVSITYTDTGILINSVIPGGAAEEAGLVPGDTIVAIDGESCVPGRESDSTRIAGEAGTSVELTILHADGTRQGYAIVRRSFTVPTATTEVLDNGSGLIDCTSFGSTTGKSFTDGVEGNDSQVDLWLVDLRGNGGGLTSAAVEASGVFTGPGTIYYLRDGAGAYYSDEGVEDYLTESPAVVLTNAYSASASEIFASAIKDYRAGIVVGGRTYGKGVAQNVLDASDLPNVFHGDALKITTYRFYTSLLNTTDTIGVIPTLLVDDFLLPEIAGLLHGSAPDQASGWVRLMLNGWDLYVDAASAMEENMERAALAEIFSALPPGAEVAVGTSAGWVDMTAPQAASYLKLEYASRWFDDVSGSAYGEQLDTLATYGILQGVSKGTFAPEGTLTRAQLCALLAQALGASSNAHSPFTDVADGSWYAPSVVAMYEMGLVEGRGNGRFDPNGTLTQQEMITIMGRLADFLNANCHEGLKAVTEEMLSAPALDGFASWSRKYAWLLGMAFVDDETGEPVPLLHADLDQIAPKGVVLREEAGATLYEILTALSILTY